MEGGIHQKMTISSKRWIDGQQMIKVDDYKIKKVDRWSKGDKGGSIDGQKVIKVDRSMVKR